MCSCGRSYNKAEWLKLEYVGLHRDPYPYPDLELRNCICGSTISVATPINEFFFPARAEGKP